MNSDRHESKNTVIYLPGHFESRHEWTKNSSGQTKAERREDERQTIANDGVLALAEPPAPPPAPTFAVDHDEIQRLLRYFLIARIGSGSSEGFMPKEFEPILVPLLESGMSLSQIPRVIPIPEEHLPRLEAFVAPRQRMQYDMSVRLWPRTMEYREELIVQAKILRGTVPQTIERLKPAYVSDPDGAHRPIYLGHLEVSAIACLDCEWFTHVEVGPHWPAGDGSKIANHRSLHWDPPRDELCNIKHDSSENLSPRSFPTEGPESLGRAIYPPVAVAAHTLDIGTRDLEFHLCEACDERLGSADKAPWKMTRKIGWEWPD